MASIPVRIRRLDQLVLVDFGGWVHSSVVSRFFQNYNLPPGGNTELKRLRERSDLTGFKKVFAPGTLGENFAGECYECLFAQRELVSSRMHYTIGQCYDDEGGWCGPDAWYVSGPMEAKAFLDFAASFRASQDAAQCKFEV